jgi:hypothetical protein
VAEFDSLGMKRVHRIERDGYHAIDWRERPGLFLTHLWQRFPELVVGRYLVNTSYDSGVLTLSDVEEGDGWRMVGQLAHSPRIRSTDQIPHDRYDEWLVFDLPVQVEEFETMVNYGSFSPADFDWGEKWERFWEQIVRLHPLHVLAENDGVYLVSRDEALMTRILQVEPDAPPDSRQPSPLPRPPELPSSDSLRTRSSGGCG